MSPAMPSLWRWRAAVLAVACAVVVVLAVVLSGRAWAEDRASRAGPRSPSAALGLEAAQACVGFESCPQYPTPYKADEWPEEYKHSGRFPAGFVWGLGTAAYQIEGAYREGGRGASIWDTFTGADTVGMPGADCSYCCKEAPCDVNRGMVRKGATGNVACDHYHQWKTDVALMKSMGLKHYRLSISWSRLVPTGKVSDGVNEEGKKFYSDLIDALLAAGITPYVTLYHWDLPQGLLDPPRASAWWSRDADGRPSGEIVPDWLAYVEVCFSAFGDRVKHWITFNEPWSFTFLASGYGAAPGIDAFSNQSTDPYIAAHNVLNAHAAAVDLYRKRFQEEQGGKIGITNNCDWREPASNTAGDIAAAERAVLFQLGWFADPIFGGAGDYPLPMRRLLGDRLPKFTAEQRRLINGSADFFGLNHYGTGWAIADLDTPGPDATYASISEDGFQQAQSMWLYSSAWGFRKMLNWVKRRYQNPPLLVMENGWSVQADEKEEAHLDQSRVKFYADYLSEMRLAIVEDGVDVKGYFGFSLMDNFEWSQGYVERFGVTYVDFAFGKDEHAPGNVSDQQPTPGKQLRLRKDSSCWLEEVWRANAVVDPQAGGKASWACVKSDAFNRTFYFRESPACSQHLEVSKGGRSGSVTSVGETDDCRWGPKNVTIMGTTLVIHQDDGEDLMGFWNRAENSVEWGDGRVWEAESHPLPDVAQATAGLTGVNDGGQCAGYEKCPDYPTPFKHGEWPESYEVKGEFPKGFVWGLGTASYQVEGGYRDDGRGASIWDTYSGADTVGMPGADCHYCCREAPCSPNQGMADAGATGNVACDHYHEWRSDVALMKSMGLKNYRFSIAWPRIVPTGRIADGVEKRGIKFYSDLVDALLEEGITPYATLYHWDLPQGLLDPPRVSGWWSRDSNGKPNGEIIQDWIDYCDIVFDALGDRVKYWVTFNEPWTFVFLGSGFGKAPGIPEFSDQGRDPYVAAHNVLNAHAAAVNLYRTKYASKQGGKIGITNNADWREPKTAQPSDVAAADRTVLFQLGWFSEPIFGGNGDYPPEMRKLYGDRLPRFTTEQRRLLNGSADFFGLNHYGTSWAEYDPGSPHPDDSYAATSHDGFVQGGSVWLYGSGWGFRKLLNWVHRRYPAYSIIVTEGGWSSRLQNATAEAKDLERIQYYANYTSQMRKAIVEDGIDIRGYFAWSFMDNFEWEQGYIERFGVTFTDYNKGEDARGPTKNNLSQPTAGKQVRIRKDSSCWLEELWTTNELLEPGEFSGCAKPSAVLGEYADQRQTGCTWTIVSTSGAPGGGEVRLQPRNTGSGTGCSSLESSGLLLGTTVLADFVDKNHTTRRMSGYSSGKTGSILWGDGSVWKRLKALGTTAEEYEKWVFMS